MVSSKPTHNHMMKEGHYFIGIVKTYTYLFPNDWLEKSMKDWPYLSHLFMESIKYGICLCYVGYKYSSKKVLYFISTEI